MDLNHPKACGYMLFTTKLVVSYWNFKCNSIYFTPGTKFYINIKLIAFDKCLNYSTTEFQIQFKKKLMIVFIGLKNYAYCVENLKLFEFIHIENCILNILYM